MTPKLLQKMLLCSMTCILVVQFVSCDNILIIHPFYGGSHILTLRRVAEAMVEKGHEVTVIRWMDKNKYPTILYDNITEIVLTMNNTEGHVPLVTHEEFGKFDLPIERMWNYGLTPLVFQVNGLKTQYYYCKALLQNKVLIDQLRMKNFKVSIVDIIFNDGGLALANHLGIPVIGFWGTNFASGHCFYTPAFNPPSSLPQTFSSLEDTMSFSERIINTVYFLFNYGLMQMEFTFTNLAINYYMPEVPHPSILTANMSGVLINSNPTLDFPRLLPPSYLEVSGLHMRHSKPLPQDILEFIESSKDNGLILFSLGFNFDIQYIPKATFEGYFTVFGKLKQKIIVKAKGQPSVLPSNVKIMTSIPQSDILAHNKTVLFVSHCGIHGVMEAIKYYVPIVGIPIFADQNDNLVRLTQLGVAKPLSKDSSPEKIFDVINSALNTPSMKENMIGLSKKVESYGNPLDKATWLVEHVMETGGAEHLKLSSRHLGLFKYLCIDVILFLLCSLLFCLLVIYKIFVSKNNVKIKTN